MQSRDAVDDDAASADDSERDSREPSAWASQGALSCRVSAQPPGHLEVLTTRDLLAGAVDVRAKLGRVLETVGLGGLLVAPAVPEAAAVAGARAWGRGRERQLWSLCTSAWSPAAVCFICSMHAHTCTCTHAHTHYI